MSPRGFRPVRHHEPTSLLRPACPDKIIFALSYVGLYGGIPSGDAVDQCSECVRIAEDTKIKECGPPKESLRSESVRSAGAAPFTIFVKGAGLLSHWQPSRPRRSTGPVGGKIEHKGEKTRTLEIREGAAPKIIGTSFVGLKTRTIAEENDRNRCESPSGDSSALAGHQQIN